MKFPYGLRAARKRFNKFKHFHLANPHVYERFLELTFKTAAKKNKCGARLIWNVMRWEEYLETISGDYKLNDHYSAYYARLAMFQYPDTLEDFFELRDTGKLLMTGEEIAEELSLTKKESK